MNKNEAHKWLAASSRSIDDVQTTAPELFAMLQELAVDQAKKRLTAAFADAPAELRQRMSKLKLHGVTLSNVAGVVKEGLSKRSSEETSKEVSVRLQSLEHAGAFEDPLADRAVKLQDLALFQRHLDQARVYVVGDLAGLDDARIARVLERAPSLRAIADAPLQQMIESGDLKSSEARDLGLTASLFQLFGEDAALTTAVKSARLDRTSRSRVTSVRDLCGLDTKGWRALLERSKLAPPPGTDLDTHAATMARRVAAVYPSASFFGRLPTKDQAKPASRSSAKRRATGSELSRVFNMYPGLGLRAVTDDPKLDPKAKAQIVDRRIGLIDAVAKKHPDKELLFLDYTPGSADVAELDLGSLGMSDGEQRMVISTLKAYQRAHALTGDVDDAHAILAAGFTSATRVGWMRPDELVTATGLTEPAAKKYHDKAVSMVTMTTAAAALVLDLEKGGFDKLPASNIGPGVMAVLRQLEGYSDLFGDQGYCKCEHCRSILGPAAYFVDLMSFVQQNARRRDSKDFLPTHPLHLKARRPDLWSLPLTCENTTGLVPALDIINEILENYIAAKKGLSVTNGDRAATMAAIYGELLSKSVGSFRQPFHLALERLTAYLGHFGLSRADVGRALGVSISRVTRAELGITVLEYDTIRTPSREIEALRKLYGIPFQVVPPEKGISLPAGIESIADVEVKGLLRAMDLLRADFGALVATRLVAAGSGTPPKIEAVKTSSESVQNDREEIGGLTNDILDRMHRFTRLWRKLPWTVEELDLILSQLGDTHLQRLDKVVYVRRIQERLGSSVEETCALFSTIPETAVTAGAASLMDRLFNPASFVATSGKLPSASSSMSSAALPRVLAGLGVSHEDFEHLTTALSSKLGSNPDRFRLSLKNLSLLYRHARLAARLGLSIPQLFQLIDVIPTMSGAVNDVYDLLKLLDVHAWWQTSGYSLDELGVIVGKGAATTFGTSKAMDVVTSLLADQSSSSPLLERLAKPLARTQAEVSALIALTGRDPADPGLLQALGAADAAAADAKPLLDLVAALLPLSLLFKHPAFDADALDFVRASPGTFGLGIALSPTLDSVQAISVYSDMAGGSTTAQLLGDLPPIDPMDLRAAIADFDAADGVLLGRVLRTTPGIAGVLKATCEQTSTIPALKLAQLARCVEIARRLGVSPDIPAKIIASRYEPLATAADAVLGAIRATCAGEADFQAKIQPKEGVLRSQRRDALTDYLMRSLTPVFESRRAISQYFLIDVDIEGCARTSRVVSATGSVQLYVQRCLMGLEQSPADAPDPVQVRIDGQAAGEWEWRKAYRRWEANRKVFLYPENYLEPDLRDDKTPLFEALESELLQKQIHDQSVLDAYASYMTGFEEVGKLSIVGAYHDGASDTLHLLGVTSVEPPAYYHRTLKNPRVDPAQGALWSPWRKLNVQIPVRRAAPVVYLGRLHVFWIEVRTQSVNKVETGGSSFVGYRHKLTLKYTFMRLDGQWAAPQEVNLPVMKEGGGTAGVVTDYFDLPHVVIEEYEGYRLPKIVYPHKPRLDPEHEHKEPIDSYTLSGPNWEEVFLQPIGSSMLRLVTRNFRLNIDVDLFNRTTKMIGDVTPAPPAVAPSPNIQLLHARNPDKGKSLSLYSGWATHWYTKSRNAFANLVLDRRRIETFDWEYGWGKDEVPIKEELYGSAIPIMEVPRGSKLLAISGSIGDVIVQAEREAFLIQYCVPGFSLNYTLRRAGTSHATNFAQTLFMQGIDGLLDTHHQETLEETHTIAGSFDDRATKTKSLDFDGPYGVYYREIFFHIPHIVADHLNSQGQFAAAQRWYHYVFNPTADAVNDSEGAGRMWRYREFRHPSVETLRQILMNGAAISAYRQDPFNPHAIARLRPSAYQKSVVMKYIDNLLDWGDSLFSEFTMESVNEATMLYTMAADILGERPYEVGDCGEPSEEVTYEQLEPSLSAELPFLIELESYVTGSYSALNSKSSAKVAKASPEGALHRLAPEIIDDAIRKSLPGKADPGAGVTEEKSPSGGSAPSGRWWTHTTAAGWTTGKGARRNGDKSSQPLIDHGMKLADSALAPSVGQSILRQVGPVFCVPVNKELLAYWDRVEDRLYKIHNCLDIHGVRRDLALFAPEIDPRLLVKMKAEGLTLDEVWSVTSGDLPPYRFLYLVEKAKAFASTLRELGNALLAALEKKDSEELGRLRLTHEQNLAKMSTQLRKWEIDAAEEAQKQAQQQKEAAELRRDYYRGLIDQDLTRWEQTEQTARRAASRFKIEASLFSMAAAISYLVPQIGSPFAMKFGGKELGDSFSSFASVLHGAASVAEAEASSTGAEAHFDRRRTDWKHQRDLADRDVKQLERQIKAAEIRKQIAEKSLEIHEKTMEQTEEVYAFYADKLTSFGLYTWMATTLQRGYREAYSNALAIARQCEVAFRFERDEELDVPVGTGAWDASRAGLLAGEQLLLDLQRLERRFIETNYRTLEVEQSFALTQIDPAALYKLRETGECVFEIPEVFFDLAYPGHYRRRIKAVRLTIPCVTGPYTNVGATLTLQGSQVRVNAHDATLKVVPPQGTVSIATSRAQNDAGVFELSFHDERYVPFEGAGAVSSWKLTLPKSFRPFDYDTISDVVVTIAYTALADSVLRTKVEALSAQAEGAILKVLSQPQNALVRVISLRQELPMAYKALLHSPVGTEVGFEIQDWHFPAFVSANGRKMVVTETRVALKTAEGVSIDGVELVVDGDTVEGFVVDGDLGGLPSKKLDSTKVFTKAVKKVHKVAVSAAGGLGAAPQSGDFAALDAEKLLDILVYVRFNVA